MINEKDFSESVRNMRNRTTRMEREGDYWTEDEKEELCRLFNSSVGITEIAIRLQRTEPAVGQQIEKMDLYQRKENPTRRRGPTAPCACLCEACRVDMSACPRRADCFCSQEG